MEFFLYPQKYCQCPSLTKQRPFLPNRTFQLKMRRSKLEFLKKKERNMLFKYEKKYLCILLCRNKDFDLIPLYRQLWKLEINAVNFRIH